MTATKRTNQTQKQDDPENSTLACYIQTEIDKLKGENKTKTKTS